MFGYTNYVHSIHKHTDRYIYAISNLSTPFRCRRYNLLATNPVRLYVEIFWSSREKDNIMKDFEETKVQPGASYPIKHHKIPYPTAMSAHYPDKM